jgi:hypothetical protein
MAALAGLNGLLLYFLATKVVDRSTSLRPGVFVASIIAIGLTGPIFLSQVGTSFADPLCSLLILGGILFLYMRRTRGFVLSGLALGAAVGLKLTTAPFAIAAFIGLLVAWRDWAVTPRRLSAFCVGGMLGFLLTGGYWALTLYLETGSPVFPFYNGVFQSPLYGLDNFADPRFRPESVGSALLYPLRLFLGQHPTAEVAFREPRFLMINGLLAVYLWQAVARRGASANTGEQAGGFRFFLTFFVVSYVIWLALWGIQRYATTLEVLSGLLIFLLVDRVVSSERTKLVTTSVLALFAVLTTVPASWGRLEFGAQHFVHVGDYPEQAEPNILYTIMGGEPLGYVLPALAQDARFVRLTGNHGDQRQGTPLGRRIADVINEHSGSIITLSVGKPRASDIEVLATYGLRLRDPADCDRFDVPPLPTFWSCKIVRDRGSSIGRSGGSVIDPGFVDGSRSAP